MKKIVSLVLCLVMLLSLGSVAIAANETPAPEADPKELFATFVASGIMVDGKIDAFMTMSQVADTGNAIFGAAWDAEYLYIGMTGVVVGLRNTWQASALSGMNASLISVDTATVKIGEKEYSTEEGKAGNADVEVKDAENLVAATTGGEGNYYVEFGIPFSDLEITELEDGSAVIENVTLSYNGADSQNKFEGTIVLTDTSIVAKQDMTGRQDDGQGARVGQEWWSGNAGNRTRTVSSQLLCTAYTVGVKAGNMPLKDYPKAVEAYTSNDATTATILYPQRDNAWTGYLYTKSLKNESNTVAQQDMYITGLPEADLTTIVAESSDMSRGAYASIGLTSNEFNPARVLLSVGWGSSNPTETSTGYVIYNTADGLVLYDDLARNKIELGVNQNEWFTLRLEITPQGEADVYVNGEFLATMPASTNTMAFVRGHGFNSGFATSITAGNTVSPAASGNGFNAATIHVRNPFVCNQKAEATAALNKLLGKVVETNPPATTAKPSKPSTPSTSAPSGDNTPGDGNATQAPTDTTEKKGCGSSIAGGAIALICTVSLAGVALKKRKH